MKKRCRTLALLSVVLFPLLAFSGQSPQKVEIKVAKLFYLLLNGTLREDPVHNVRIDINQGRKGVTFLSNFKPMAGFYKGLVMELQPLVRLSFADGHHKDYRLKNKKLRLEQAFTIPKNAFYTQSIDWAYHINKAQIMLKAQLHDAQALYGIFSYTKPGTKKSFTLKLLPNDRIETILQIRPKWVISGTYEYKSQDQTVQLMPSTAQCPSCSSFKNFFLRAIPIPDPVAYRVVGFGRGFIDIINETKEYVHMKKADLFRLYLK